MTAVDVHVRIRIIQPAHENGAQPDISAPTSTRASTAAADRCSYTPGPSNIAMNDPQVAMSVSSRRHRRSMLSMIPRHIVCAHTQDRSVQIPQQSPPKANRGPACLRSLGMRQTTQRLPALAHWKRRVSKQQGPGVAKVQSTSALGARTSGCLRLDRRWKHLELLRPPSVDRHSSRQHPRTDQIQRATHQHMRPHPHVHAHTSHCSRITARSDRCGTSNSETTESNSAGHRPVGKSCTAIAATVAAAAR